MIQVGRFDPQTATEPEWAALHAHRRRAHAESRPDEPFDPDGLAEQRLRRVDPQEIVECLWARSGDDVAAWAEVWIPRPGSPGYESNRDFVWFRLYVLREHRRRGILRALLPHILEITTRHGGRVLGTDADEEDGITALEGHGFARRSEARYSRLDLARLDWDEIRRQAEEGQRRSPGRRLRLYVNAPPPELLPAYCSAMTELFNTIPWDDVDHGDIVFTPETVRDGDAHHERMGGVMNRLLVQEPDGRLTGVTEMLVFPDAHPEHAHQWLTAVHRSVQGNGIGRWLKTAMLLEIHERFPKVRWVLTDNASSNSYMLRINIDLGFETYRVDRVYQVDVAELTRRVAART